VFGRSVSPRDLRISFHPADREKRDAANCFQDGARLFRYPDLARGVVAEALGTAFLLADVGSAITGDRLAGGDVAMVLLANTVATVATLVALILTFGTISVVHFNQAIAVLILCTGNSARSQVAEGLLHTMPATASKWRARAPSRAMSARDDCRNERVGH
jgi:hypothetical protein